MFPKNPPLANDILEAANRINSYIHHTPVLTNASINQISGCDLYFKCENFQKAGAFKSRGAANAVFSLSPELLKNGVATHSSGNHAAALAKVAAFLKIPAYIVMPSNSSKVKIEAVKNYGAHITFCKPTLSDRELTLKEVIERTDAIEIHPYDNYAIIAGQATATLELTNEIPGLEKIITPVGGGGLLSGTALASYYFSPATQVMAAEPSGADDAFRSLLASEIVPSIDPNTVCDGLRTSLGERNFPIIKQLVKEIVLVDDKTTIAAMKMIWDRMKIITEVSSAITLGAILQYPEKFRGQKIGIILSGGNVDTTALPWNTIN
jgi:threonine dehydratase